MDSGYSSHMTGKTKNFLSLKTFCRDCVSFGDGNKWHILVVRQFGKSLYHTIEYVFNLNRLNYNLLSVSEICDKRKKVKFVSNSCIVTNIKIG